MRGTEPRHEFKANRDAAGQAWEYPLIRRRERPENHERLGRSRLAPAMSTAGTIRSRAHRRFRERLPGRLRSSCNE
jgi:hypothetical protein